MRFTPTAAPLAGLFLLAVAGTALAQPASPTIDERPKIAVLGEGEASGAPDIAMASLTVLRTGESAQSALDEANAAVTAVTQAMRDIGIQSRDLQTAGFSITPQYRYDNRNDGTALPPAIVGYEVRNSLSVRVRDLTRLGELLDRAVTLGVNQGGDIAFQMEDPSPLQDAARRSAVERARRSAEALAEAAGLTLGAVISITDEDGPSRPIPMGAEFRMMAAPASDSVPVEIGESTINARVRIVYELTGGGAN